MAAKSVYFGICSADWSKSHTESITKFCKIIFLISFKAYRLSELNFYRGDQDNIYLVIFY